MGWNGPCAAKFSDYGGTWQPPMDLPYNFLREHES
jgi:hypothetical protein